MGFSRAVRVGNMVSVAGTAPIAEGGGTACPGDAYGQMKRCIEISRTALQQAGATLDDVVRTRILLTNIDDWQAAAKAHGEIFGSIRPVITVMAVSGFVDPAWLVETEMDAIVEGRNS